MHKDVDNFAIVIPHTHWDREWYLPFEAFRMKLVALVDRLCEMLETDPEDSFHFDGQTIILEDYEEIRGRSETLRKLVKEGRIQIGPWYILPDEFLPSGEAHIRNFQLGIRIAQKWGEPCMVGYLPDMFGHIGQMPQILKGFGIKRATLWRGVSAEIDKCGFRWKAPDGSEVFTAFLPMGYANGFNLPADPVALGGRIMLTRGVMGRFIEGPTWLLMAGTDHQQPKPELPDRLKKAFENTAGWEVKVGTFEEYFDRLESESVARPVATGELRDPHYAPILPGTASTRMYLKRRDFQVSSLIERYAEPLMAWAWALGGADRKDFIEYAWKLLIQNHPHDSICGCSTDEVHREMETRYDRIHTVAKRTLDASAEELGRMMKFSGKNRFGVWRPAGACLKFPIITEIDGRPGKSSVLVDPDGKHSPLQTLEQIEPGETVAKVNVPSVVAQFAMAFLFQEEEMLGGYMVRADIKKEEGAVKVMVGIGQSPAGLDIEDARDRVEKALASSGAPLLKLEVVKEPRVRIAAVCEGVAPYSIGAFQIKRSKEKVTSDLKVEERIIENSFLRLVVEDNGTLTIHDKRHDTTFKNALVFVDEGDRGDEYTFEPVENDEPIDTPDKVRIKTIHKGPVAAGMRIESTYKIPVGLDRSGRARSKRMVPTKLVTDVLLYSGIDWIDFRTRFVNPAKDHRLRVLFGAPFQVDEFLAESAFEVVRRKAGVAAVPRKPDPTDVMSLLIGPEARVGFGPHRGFAALENGSAGMAVFNKGLSEIEAIKTNDGTALALTLLRSVGAISRDDLSLRSGHAGPPTATPEGQCLGEQICEFAFTAYGGSWQKANLVALAHSWRHPAFMFPISAGKGKLEPGDAPICSDNPAIEIRALQPAPDGSKALCARIYNTTDKPQSAQLKLHKCFKDYSEADLMGNRIDDTHIKREGSHSATVSLPPARIMTLRLEIN